MTAIRVDGELGSHLRRIDIYDSHAPDDDRNASADDYLKVHHRGPSDADVTEGSAGVWERLHYDWS